MNERIEIGLPDKLQIRRRGSEIEIVRSWFGPKTVFVTVFAVFWIGFLYFWYAKLGEARGEVSAVMTYFPLIHVAVGVGIAYYALCGWLNRTRITVGRGKLSLRHGPLPWIGNLELDAQAIRQVYVRQVFSTANHSTSVRYDINVLTRDGRAVKFAGGIENSEQALYIEQEVEKFLGIKDQPVKGGFPG